VIKVYVTKGMKSFKVFWKNSDQCVTHLFVESLDKAGASKVAEEYIPKLYKGLFEITKIEER
jgi:nitric oxide synthase oxygenase domain/subunit